MPSLTTNFSLNKPLVNNATDQDLWGGYLNDNMDSIDTQLLLCRDWKKRVITGTDSVLADDRHKILLCDATISAFTETLLAAATAGDGFEITIVKTDASAHAVTIDGAAAETVAGAASFDLAGQGDAATLVCDGVGNWNFKGNKTTPSAVPAASTTAAGIIEISTTAEVQAGSDSSRAVTPAALDAALGFTTYYDSGQQTYNTSNQIILTHGLGATPKIGTLELVCTTTDAGYSVGDKIILAATVQPQTGTDPGISIAYNATQILINTGAAIRVTPSGGGEGQTITTSSWRLVARAWA